MRTFSRIGMITSVTGLMSAGAAPGQPPGSESPALVAVTGGDSFSAPAASTPYTAIHVLEDAGSEPCAVFIRQMRRDAPAVAGVTHVFVAAGAPAELKPFAESLGPAGGFLYADPGARLITGLGVTVGHGAGPVTIVLALDGQEVFRSTGPGPHDHIRFEEFSRLMAEHTTAEATSQYNLPKSSNLAIGGYDPVAYIDENKATAGRHDLESTFQGVRYRFATAAHREAFAAQPQRYLPTYGGWCASAMGDKGTKVEIDPRNFKVKDGRLFLFYKSLFGDALKDWNRRENEWEPAADVNWKKLTGEDPVVPAK